MPHEPINIFSASGDATKVRSLLLTWFPDAEVEEEEDDWTKITMEFSNGNRLSILHNREYYAGSDWSRQKAGMQGYFSRFPLGKREAQLMATIGSFQFSLATEFEPDYNPPHDERLGLVCELARVLDGVLFSPSCLRDPKGRVLVAADGETDLEAEWPRIGLVVNITAFGKRAGFGEKPAVTDEDDWTPDPPDAVRVSRRALALAVVSGRAVVERDHAKSPNVKNFYKALRSWPDQLGFADELEQWERNALFTLPGKLDRQTIFNAMWRIEGLTVLAWALGLTELLPYDQLCDVDGAWKAVGLMDDARAGELSACPRLRDFEELESFRLQMLAYHWRLRDFQHREPRTMDFSAFSKNCWFGSFDISRFHLIDGDLALGGVRIDKADPDLFSTCLSIALERHLAINWLCWGPTVYSETDAST